jgi:hypothetical protein
MRFQLETLQSGLDTDITMSAWRSLAVGGQGRGYEGGIVYSRISLSVSTVLPSSTYQVKVEA